MAFHGRLKNYNQWLVGHVFPKALDSQVLDIIYCRHSNCTSLNKVKIYNPTHAVPIKRKELGAGIYFSMNCIASNSHQVAEYLCSDSDSNDFQHQFKIYSAAVLVENSGSSICFPVPGAEVREGKWNAYLEAPGKVKGRI